MLCSDAQLERFLRRAVPVPTGVINRPEAVHAALSVLPWRYTLHIKERALLPFEAEFVRVDAPQLVPQVARGERVGRVLCEAALLVLLRDLPWLYEEWL